MENIKDKKTVNKRWRKMLTTAFHLHNGYMVAPGAKLETISDLDDETLYIQLNDIVDLDLVMKFSNRELTYLIYILDYTVQRTINERALRPKAEASFLSDAENFMSRYNQNEMIEDTWFAEKFSTSLIFN